MTIRTGFRFGSFVFAVMITGSCLGQVVSPSDPVPAIESGPFYHHASTLEQGAMDGIASVIRAAGQANYNSALAARHSQTALEQALYNRVQAVHSYFERQQANTAYRLAMASPPLTKEQRERIHQNQLPDRLGIDEVSLNNGGIPWPDALQDATFDEERAKLEALFAQRSVENSGRGTRNYSQIVTTIRHMQSRLGGQVRQQSIDATMYGPAATFLRSLRYEAHLPMNQLPAASALAQR